MAAAKIEGKELVIRVPLLEPTPSKSGKTYLIGSTSGFTKVDLVHGGKQVSVSVIATIPLR